MWLSHRIHRRFKFTVVNVKDSCYLASSWIYTTNEELFTTYFTEGTTRMIGVILRVNSWISKHCSQYRSAFQHQGSFSVLEQHLLFCIQQKKLMSIQLVHIKQVYELLSSWPRDQTHITSISCTGRQVIYRLCHLEAIYISRTTAISFYCSWPK